MSYIIEHDNGVTNFHFEVAPELMTEGFITCLAKARNGLFQLEIGVQSTNRETLDIIKRRNHLDKIEIDAIDNLKNTVTKSDYFIIDLNKKKKNITLSVI